MNSYVFIDMQVFFGFFFYFSYLRSKIESSRDSDHIGSWHATANLLAELFDVRAGSVQVLEQHGEATALLTRRQESPQTSHFHSHAVQGTLGKLGA